MKKPKPSPRFFLLRDNLELVVFVVNSDRRSISDISSDDTHSKHIQDMFLNDSFEWSCSKYWIISEDTEFVFRFISKGERDVFFSLHECNDSSKLDIDDRYQ